MAVGLGGLGLAPAVFWSLTLTELSAALRGRFGIGGSAGAPSARELAELIKRFPDREE